MLVLFAYIILLLQCILYLCTSTENVYIVLRFLGSLVNIFFFFAWDRFLKIHPVQFTIHFFALWFLNSIKKMILLWAFSNRIPKRINNSKKQFQAALSSHKPPNKSTKISFSIFNSQKIVLYYIWFYRMLEIEISICKRKIGFFVFRFQQQKKTNVSYQTIESAYDFFSHQKANFIVRIWFTHKYDCWE